MYVREEIRDLTSAELALVSWLIENPAAGLTHHREQLPRLMVVATCTCGCPTVDFGVRPDLVRHVGPTETHADAVGVSPEGEPVDVILHVRDGELSELEVVSHSGHQPVGLPRVEDLRYA